MVEGTATFPDSEDRQKSGVCQEGSGPLAAWQLLG